MSKALLIIDYTNDFVADDGKLTCGKAAQDIENNIAAKVRQYYETNEYIIIANDLHYKDDLSHPESRLFPEHNISGTEGRNVYGKVGDLLNEILKSKYSKIRFFDKTRYSAFAKTYLQAYLEEENIDTIELCGVCTDICILHTAVDAYNLGYFNTIIDSRCVASFNQTGHDWALNHFRNTLGFTVY
ncbi:MAG TPA: cysteine hydrolase [Clostridiales bacterium]|nr:cysteine hydrolase [Clostridiales bacterium]